MANLICPWRTRGRGVITSARQHILDLQLQLSGQGLEVHDLIARDRQRAQRTGELRGIGPPVGTPDDIVSMAERAGRLRPESAGRDAPAAGCFTGSWSTSHPTRSGRRGQASTAATTRVSSTGCWPGAAWPTRTRSPPTSPTDPNGSARPNWPPRPVHHSRLVSNFTRALRGAGYNVRHAGEWNIGRERDPRTTTSAANTCEED